MRGATQGAPMAGTIQQNGMSVDIYLERGPRRGRASREGEGRRNSSGERRTACRG